MGIHHHPDNCSAVRRSPASFSSNSHEPNNLPYCPLPYPAFFPRPRAASSHCNHATRRFDHTLNSLLLYSVGYSPCPGLRLPSVTINAPNALPAVHIARGGGQTVSPAKCVQDVSSSQRHMSCNLSHKDRTTTVNTMLLQRRQSLDGLPRAPHRSTFTIRAHSPVGQSTEL